MEIIQSVELVRGKRKIVFDSGWTVWLKQNDLPSFPLTPGTEVNRGSFEQFILLKQYPYALDRAVRMLAERPCSRKEIERRLTSARIDASVTELVLFKLEKENLLDDRAFADQWVLSRSRKYGSARILRELRMKGVDQDTAQAAVENFPEEDQAENAVSFAGKKIRSLQGTCEPFRMKQRVLSALVRRGYSWEIAAKAYEEALRKAD